MKNTLNDLNNYLFENLERLMDDNLDEESLKKEILRSKAVTGVAETIVRNGELALRTMEHLNEYGYGNNAVHERTLAPVPAMLEAKTS